MRGFRKKPDYIIFNLHNVKPKAGYINAEMSWKDFIETIKEEKPEYPYTIMCEDGVNILYINSPVGCYRITLIKDDF